MNTLKNKLGGFAFMAVMAAVLLGSGCATTRGELDVRSTVQPNPQTGTAVKIVSVEDRRVFEVSPKSASIPSLKGSEINDKAITSRAIARKRNTYGKALGDILLPEGRTVPMLARENITQAFRQAGYRVLEAGDADYGQAVPVTVEIRKFWAWMTPGFWALTVEFETEMNVTGSVGKLGAGKVVRGYVRNSSAMATSGIWLDTVQQGLTDFVSNLKKEL